jgi:hypothetical protein
MFCLTVGASDERNEVGKNDGWITFVGFFDGRLVGDTEVDSGERPVGLEDDAGVCVAFRDGFCEVDVEFEVVGFGETFSVGFLVGLFDGFEVEVDGCSEIEIEGRKVEVGCIEGDGLGAGDSVGMLEGGAVGLRVGGRVGDLVGRNEGLGVVGTVGRGEMVGTSVDGWGTLVLMGYFVSWFCS